MDGAQPRGGEDRPLGQRDNGRGPRALQQPVGRREDRVLGTVQIDRAGDMDLGAYIEALDTIGFSGPLALDLYNEDYESVGPEAIAFLRALLPWQPVELATESRP